MNGHLGDRAAAYVDGALDPAEEARARAHLTSCTSCQDRVVEQLRVRDLLRGAASTGPVEGSPPALLAALSSMPLVGVPDRPSPASVRGLTRRSALRRGAVSGVAVGATVLASAWVVGAPVPAAGPAAVPPDRLLEQHVATAGELPFWGSDRATTVAVGNTDAATALLRKAAAAASTTSYHGVELVTTRSAQGAQTTASEVSHVAGRGTSVQTLAASLPTSGVFRPETATQTTASLDAVGLLERSYVLVTEGTESVAGRTADQIGAYDASGVLVARFWVDRATGLPLAREERAPDGTATRAMTFTSLSVADVGVMPGHLPVATTAVWVDAPNAPETLEAEGWVCPDTLAAVTGLTAFDARLTEGQSGPVLHLVYTDGLLAVSVFQQRAVIRPATLAGFEVTTLAGHRVYRRAGVPSEVTWASGPMVFTVVGSPDGGLVDRVVAALPHEPAGSGSRAGHGLARVGSWFDPFG